MIGKFKSLTILLIGLLLLTLSFAPFLFIKELPSGNKGQLIGLFSMLWTLFTMIPAILFCSAGFIVSMNELIQSKFNIHHFLSAGISALILSKSSLFLASFVPKFSHSLLNEIINLIFGFFEFFLFYPSLIAILIGIVLTIRNRKK